MELKKKLDEITTYPILLEVTTCFRFTKESFQNIKFGNYKFIDVNLVSQLHKK